MLFAGPPSPLVSMPPFVAVRIVCVPRGVSRLPGLQTGAVLYFAISVDALGTLLAPNGQLGKAQFLEAWKSVNDSLELAKEVRFGQAGVHFHLCWGGSERRALALPGRRARFFYARCRDLAGPCLGNMWRKQSHGERYDEECSVATGARS